GRPVEFRVVPMVPSRAAVVLALGGAGEVIAHWSSRASTGLVEALLLLITIVLLRLAIRKLWLADFAAAVLIAIIVGGLRPVWLPAWLTFHVASQKIRATAQMCIIMELMEG